MSLISFNILFVIFFCNFNSIYCFIPTHINRITNSFTTTTTSTTSLQLDIFGLGPAEVVVIAGAAALLFGPDRIKSQLRESGVKNSITSEGYKAEREERIKTMKKYAKSVRKKRTWQRINIAIEDEDETIMKKLTEYEDGKL